MSNKRVVEAPKDHVILRQVDDNIYNEKDLQPGELMKQQEVALYEYKGEVLSVGVGVEEKVSVGEYIHHAKHSGTVFTFDNEGLLCLPAYLICGIEKRVKP